MIKPLISIAFLSSAMVLPLAPASALTDREVKQCKAMGASIKVRERQLTERGEARMSDAEAVEAAGEAWENAETIRPISAQHAADADAKKAAYDKLKTDFMRADMAYQSEVAMVNNDVAAFNGVCLPKKN